MLTSIIEVQSKFSTITFPSYNTVVKEHLHFFIAEINFLLIDTSLFYGSRLIRW
jgi:hypothetical protein